MTRRPVLPAAFAVVLLVVGQLVALAHEASTRHITCARHGEQLEAATLVGARHVCQKQHWVAVEGNGGGHIDCAISRALHQSATRSSDHAIVAILTASPTEASVVACLARPVTLYRFAPKTSPPSTPITLS